jgi:hypothetical protein
MRRQSLLATVAAVTLSCGGSGSTTGPSTATSTNHNPVIAAVSVSPASGISQVTTVSFSVTASDPDGDPLSYAWVVTGDLALQQGSNFLSSAAAGTSVLSYVGTGALQVTVTDGRGGSSTASQPLALGTIAGNWTSAGGTPCGILPLGFGVQMSLKQTGGAITETASVTANDGIITVGDILASNPGTVTSTGHVTFDVVTNEVQGTVLDALSFVGDLDSTFQHVTYTVTDIGPQFPVGVPSPCSITLNKS